MISSVNDKDTVQDPFYFYLVSEEGGLLTQHLCVTVATNSLSLYYCTDVECNEAFCVDVNTGQIRLDGDLVSM